MSGTMGGAIGQESVSRRTLLDITADLQALDDLLMDLGGDVTDPQVEAAVNEWMATLGEDLETKVDNYAALIREKELRAEAREKETHRLMQLAVRDHGSAKWLRSRLLQAFGALGIKKLKTARFNVSVVANGGPVALQIPDEAAVPEAYRLQPPTEPDREKIREALDCGASLSFASLGERGKHLSIR